jgi:hypothetical protein
VRRREEKDRRTRNEEEKEDNERRREEKERRMKIRKKMTREERKRRRKRMERLSCTVLYFKGSVGSSARPFQFQTEMGILLTFSSGKKSGFYISSIKKNGISFKQSSVL